MKSLLLATGLMALTFASCSKIETFKFKDPNVSDSSDNTAPQDVTLVVKSISITQYDHNNTVISKSTKYVWYDTLYPEIAISTTPITDTVQPFTGYIYTYGDQYGDLTHIEGRYNTAPDSIRFSKMDYNYDDQGRILSADRLALDGTESHLPVTQYDYDNGLQSVFYSQDIPVASDQPFVSLSRYGDGSVSYIGVGDNLHQISDTFLYNYNDSYAEEATDIRYNTDVPGSYTFFNIKEIDHHNGVLRNFHRKLFFGVEFFPGAFFDDGLNRDVVRQFQPYIALTTDVILVQPDNSRVTTTFQNTPVFDQYDRLVRSDFFTIIDNQICTQRWEITYY